MERRGVQRILLCPAPLVQKREDGREKNMAYRKFFYGDRVLITGEKYRPHRLHEGRVEGTLIRSQRVTYRVACDCGKNIKPKAFHMDLVSTPHREIDPLSIHDARMEHFLRAVGKDPKRPRLSQQVKSTLSQLNERDSHILTKRFGLDGDDGKTHQEIGDEIGITKARVHQIEQSLLRRLQI